MSWHALDRVIAKRRRALGDRPSLEELVALREGRLATEERERLREWAAVDPDFARQLIDVLDYPDLPSAEEAPSEALKEARWRQFQELLRTEVEAPPAVAEQQAPFFQAPPTNRWSSRWSGIAASFLIGTLAGALGVQVWRPVPEGTDPPLGNVEIISPALDQAPGTRGKREEISGSAQWVLPTLGTSSLPAAARYGVLVRDSAGDEVWRRGDLVAGTGGLLTPLIPAMTLAPGSYRAEIYLEGDFETAPIATATWTLDAAVP